MEDNNFYNSIISFYFKLKDKYPNLQITFSYLVVRLYIKDDKNNKTKTILFISKDNGDIFKNLKKRIIIGNIYDINHILKNY
jgi:hypothetical protein